jgi:hypothetical protein
MNRVVWGRHYRDIAARGTLSRLTLESSTVYQKAANSNRTCSLSASNFVKNEFIFQDQEIVINQSRQKGPLFLTLGRCP